MVAWLVVPFLIICLRATADALTENGPSTLPIGPPQPILRSGGIPGVWTTSGGATVSFTAGGRFTETNLPNPPRDDDADARLTVPQSASGTWQLEGSAAGSQHVLLTFHAGISLDLAIKWQPASSRHGSFILQPHAGSSAGRDPAYQIIRQRRHTT